MTPQELAAQLKAEALSANPSAPTPRDLVKDDDQFVPVEVYLEQQRQKFAERFKP